MLYIKTTALKHGFQMKQFKPAENEFWLPSYAISNVKIRILLVADKCVKSMHFK